MKFWHHVRTYYILQVHEIETNETTNIGIFKTYKKANKFGDELYAMGAYPTQLYTLTIQEIELHPSAKAFGLFLRNS
mgnify:CR=1 FL=1